MCVMAAFSARHYRLLRNGSCDTPDKTRDRIVRREAGEQAYAEAKDRFPTITAENFDDVLRWQESRITALIREKSAK